MLEFLAAPPHLETGPTNRSNSVTVEKYIITSMAYEQKARQNRKAEMESVRKFKYL